MSAVSHNTGYAAGYRRQLPHLAVHQFLQLTVHQFRADLRCFSATRGACSLRSPSRSCFS